MAPDNDISFQQITRQMHDRQRRLGRIMRNNNVTLKAVSIDSGIPYNTLRAYFPAGEQADLFPSILPITALVKLFGVLPDEWLSILTEPEGRCFASTEDDDGTIAELEAAAKQVSAALAKAKARAGVA